VVHWSQWSIAFILPLVAIIILLCFWDVTTYLYKFSAYMTASDVEQLFQLCYDKKNNSPQKIKKSSFYSQIECVFLASPSKNTNDL